MARRRWAAVWKEVGPLAARIARSSQQTVITYDIYTGLRRNVPAGHGEKSSKGYRDSSATRASCWAGSAAMGIGRNLTEEKVRRKRRPRPIALIAATTLWKQAGEILHSFQASSDRNEFRQIFSLGVNLVWRSIDGIIDGKRRPVGRASFFTFCVVYCLRMSRRPVERVVGDLFPSLLGKRIVGASGEDFDIGD